MANSRQDEPSLLDLNLDIIRYSIPAQAASPLEAVQLMGRLSQTCRTLHTFFQPKLKQIALQHFLQAVIDDKRETVEQMLAANPRLLLATPPANLVIESQYTWQRFIAENPVAMAAKRHQIEMLKIMVPVLNKLIDENPELNPQAEAMKASIEDSWNVYQGTPDNIPAAYTVLVDGWIKTFIQDQTASCEGVNEATEAALKTFRELLLPENPVALNQYYDIGLLLYTAYKHYSERFDDFQSWDQRDAFCIRVIGGLQSMLPPEDAKVFCEGLYYVVEKGRKISGRARSLKLYGGENFYPSPRDDFSGIGFKYLVGPVGLCRVRARCGLRGGPSLRGPVADARLRGALFGKTISNKNSELAKLMQPSQQRKVSHCIVS